MRLAAAGASILAAAFAIGVWVVAPLAAVQALAAWADAASGRSASTGRVTVNPFTLTITLRDVVLSTPAGSLSADRAGLDFDIAALFGRAVALDELALDGARLQVADAGARASAEAGRPLGIVPTARISIARIAVSGGRIEWLAEDGPPLVLDGVTAHALNVDPAADAPAHVEIDVRDAVGGVLRIEGEVALGAGTAEGRIVFENVDAAPIASRLFATPSFAGTSSGTAELEWRADPGVWHLRDARVRATRAAIEWADGGTLSAASLEGAGDAELAASAPLSGRVWLDSLALAGPRATIVLGAASDIGQRQALDHVLGLLSAPREPAGDVSRANASMGTVTLAVDRVELADGQFEIVDAGLAGARRSVTAADVEGVVERVGGGITASLAARVGDEGTATLDVRTAFGDASARDVTLDLEAVPADIFAEHAERLAGFSLDGGTVNATIEYRIDSSGVDGHARVGARGVAIEPIAERVDDVTGNDVPGDDVPRNSVPGDDVDMQSIRLALALLEDAHGVAETAFDFRAPSDAADTRIGALLASGVVARLRAVAASPFEALGAAAGVDGAALEGVSFPAGEAEPTAPGTLDALADALHARPRVGLRVQGVAHRTLDRDALAAQQIELHVTLATAGPTLVARPRPVDFASPRHRDVLDEFAGERLSDEQRETIASYFARTPDGRIVEAERSAYYRALFDALVANETIPQSGIERLGRYRARAIANGLTARGIAETRIEIAPAILRSDDDIGAGGREGPPGAAASPSEAAPSAPGDSSPASEVKVPLEVIVPDTADGAAQEPAPGQSDGVTAQARAAETAAF